MVLSMRNIIFTWPCCLKLETVYSDPHERKFVNERFAGSRTGNYVTPTGNECYSLAEACIPRSVINEWVPLDKERSGRQES